MNEILESCHSGLVREADLENVNKLKRATKKVARESSMEFDGEVINLD